MGASDTFSRSCFFMIFGKLAYCKNVKNSFFFIKVKVNQSKTCRMLNFLFCFNFYGSIDIFNLVQIFNPSYKCLGYLKQAEAKKLVPHLGQIIQGWTK